MTSISDTNVVNAPGGLVELAYAKINTSVVLGTSSGVVISPVTVVCDGSPILVEFFAVMTTVGSGAGSYGITQLMVDGAVTGRMTQSYTASAIGTIHFGGCYGSQRLTPSAGVHTFGINGYRSSAASAEINAGSGVGDDYPPAFIRISKIIQASQLIVQTPNAPLVTSLPSNAIDGQEVRYLVDNTNGIVWNFRYRAGSSSAYKWEFIGGTSLFAEGNGGGNNVNMQHTTYSTVGSPSVTIPLQGDYIIKYGALSRENEDVFYTDISLAAFFNGSQLSAPNEVYMVGNGGSDISVQTLTHSQKKTLTVSGATLDVRHRIAQAGRNYAMWNMWLEVQPIRVSA